MFASFNCAVFRGIREKKKNENIYVDVGTQPFKLTLNQYCYRKVHSETVCKVDLVLRSSRHRDLDRYEKRAIDSGVVASYWSCPPCNTVNIHICQRGTRSQRQLRLLQ